MGCCNKGCLARFLIGLINALILVACIILMAVVYSHISGGEGEEYFDLFKNSAAFLILILLLIFCVIVCVVGFLLWCCTSKCWRVFYVVCLTVIVVAEIALVVVFFVCTDTVLDSIQDEWTTKNEDEGIAKAIRSAELHFHCCGFNETTAEDRARCWAYTQEPDTEYKREYIDTTCYKSFEKLVKDNLQDLGIGTVVILVVEIILYIMSVYYACLSNEQIAGEEDITKTN